MSMAIQLKRKIHAGTFGSGSSSGEWDNSIRYDIAIKDRLARVIALGAFVVGTKRFTRKADIGDKTYL
jgi:hypothetical protein